jgi:hypothetical protein
MRPALYAALLLALGALAGGCGGNAEPKAAQAAAPACPKAWQADWQSLANRIGAPVYCPAWLPAPFTGEIARRTNFGGTLSVDPDRSYLATFVWMEPQSGEVHVNIRGYPGRTAIPTCVKEDSNQGTLTKVDVPCFADPRGTVRARGISGTVYTVNQDTDRWHVLYAWRHAGGLYTVSEHVAVPLTYRKVVANLNRMLRNLVLVEPQAS